ncbi:MAG: MGMT family protein [Promethearchaeota archaeon]
MTSFFVDARQVERDRWISVAIDISNGKLVASMTPTKSAKEALGYINKIVQRLHRSDYPVKEYSSSHVIEITNRLWQLFQGYGQEFKMEEISTDGWTAARIEITQKLLQIPRGSVISYGALAKRAQSSPRGVGSVMASNPLPLAVPCHRVIHIDGRIGKFGRSIKGSVMKAALLRAEGVPFRKKDVVEESAIIK